MRHYLVPGPITRRLLPLYCAAFLQGFVLWYVIEKLFMRGIGFNDALIGVMAAMYSVVMLLAETPSGILADRWSRKGVLMIGSLALAVSTFLCGVSNGVALYIVGAMVWGIFYALYSGTYDSVVYDVLVEENGTAAGYDTYYGRVHIADSVALIVGSLLGGVIAELFGLQAAFFWTLPITLLSIVSLALFREPRLHKAETATPLGQHVRNTFKVILNRGVLTYILAALMCLTVASTMLLEFSQLWYIAIALPVAAYGVANSCLFAARGIAGFVAPWMTRRTLLVIMICVGSVSAVGLTLRWAAWIIVGLQAAFAVVLAAATIQMNHRMHDELPSQVRAGASSAVSTLGRLLFIPLAILFGQMSDKASIFDAAWLPLVFWLLAAALVLGISRQSKPAYNA